MQRDDAELHVRGTALFVDDVVLPADSVYVVPVTSVVAHARIVHIDVQPALACPGVCAVLTAADIPGSNQIGNIGADEVLLAAEEIVYHGQVLALVAAATEQQARTAAQYVVVDYQALPAVFEVREAHDLGLHIAPQKTFAMGDVASVWQDCACVVQGAVACGGQEHMYLETQVAIAYPLENQSLRVLSATQSPGMTQKVIAKVLAVAMHQIEVDVLRLGGGFGGKEEQASPIAAMAAWVALRLQKTAKLVLRRAEDSRITGKRHPYEADYRLGLDAEGHILAYQVMFYQNAGAWADLSLAILERSLFHAGGSYFIPHLQASAVSCRTHLPPNTAFRGFGAPQAMFVLEAALFAAGQKMGIAVSALQQRNLLRNGQVFYYGMPVERCQAEDCWQTLQDTFQLAQTRQAIERFNAENLLLKKALALMPVCFGIAFTARFLNQADALVHVYADGSVSVSCGAVEMGQGVKAKIAKVAALTLGVDRQRIRVETTNTRRIANMSPTAASTGADLNGQATRLACLVLVERLRSVAAGMADCDSADIHIENGWVWRKGVRTQIRWRQVVSQAYMQRIGLSAQAHYATEDLHFDDRRKQGKPFAYHVYGCAAVQVTLDVLRGRYQIDRVDVVHDVGQSLDESIDRGQIEGAVVQGLGWLTSEAVLFDAQGRLLSEHLSHYKIPDLHAAPEINVHFLPAADNPAGLLNAKAVGEPPLMYGIAGYFALCEAILAANPHWQLDFSAPMTPEKVLLALYAERWSDAEWAS